MRILGMDVSHWDEFTNWDKAKSMGIRFGIYKMSDFYRDLPIGFTDSKMLWNRANTRRVGIINGGYHWLQPKIDPIVQAKYYTDLYMKYPTDLPPILDFEDKNINSPSDALWRAQEWLEFVEAATGRTPIVYTSNGYMRMFDRNKVGFLNRFPLWIAQYPYFMFSWSTPKISYTPWTTWTFWQWTETARAYLYGSQKTYVDLNYFNGTEEELIKLTQFISVPEPVIYQKYKITATLGLRVRSSPDSSSTTNILYTLAYGSIVEVEKIESGWGKLANKEQYIYMAYTVKV